MNKKELNKLKSLILQDGDFLTEDEALGDVVMRSFGVSKSWTIFKRFPNRWNIAGRQVGLIIEEEYNSEEFSFTFKKWPESYSLQVKECSFFVVDLDSSLYQASHWLETRNLPNQVIKSLNLWKNGNVYQFDEWEDIKEESESLTEKQVLDFFFTTCLPLENEKLNPKIWSKIELEIFWESFTDEILQTEQPEDFIWVNQSSKKAA